MSFLNGNCCLKLNYLICGSKDFSSKKKKFKLPQNDIRSMTSSSVTFSHQYNINVTSILQQQKSPRKTFKCDKNARTRKTSGYSSSLNYSIDQSDLIHSTLNNQIIIKDVILHRKNPNERLGLTLCYGLTSKSTTNIYIEQIDQNSIADCQGKLQRGDQIIKINNQRVTNRDQAIQLVHQTSNIILQILRFQFIQTNFSTVGSTITEDDSGVILACQTDLETIHQKSSKNSMRKYSNSLSCLLSNNCSNCHQNRLYLEQVEYRRCLSLTDLTNCSFINEQIDYSIKDSIQSQNLFQITTDNEKAILKPLPFKNCPNGSDSGLVFGQYQLNEKNICHSKQTRRRYREERLKEQNKFLITTDDEIMSELKQGRYWTKEQRKQQFQRSKQYKQRTKVFQQDSIHSTTEDFNLLNRIFLQENQQELKQKPYLAVKYHQQSTIERKKLEKILEKYPFYHHLKSQSTTTMSMKSSRHHSSTIII